MTQDELQAEREARWQALRPAEVSARGLRAWSQEAGFLDASELTAWSDAGLELLEVELSLGHIVELTLWPGVHRYAAESVMRYVYACVGDRHPRRDYKAQAGARKLSWLASEVFERMLERDGRWTSAQLRDRLGAERTSALSVESALRELSSTLKVVRVAREGDGSTVWQPLAQVLPALPRAAATISLVEAAAALASQWLNVRVCGTEEELALAFAPLVSRSRLHTALTGLEAAREVSLDAIEGRPAYRLATPRRGR